MESAKPSSSAPPYPGGAGAGGKFRKPPVSRKRPSTPYDRPPLATGNNKPDESQDGGGGGGWLSKLVVNPARRLIVGGATRILPSFFSRPESPSDDEYEDDLPSDRDDEDIEAPANACDEAKHTFEIGVSRWSGEAGPSNEMDKSIGSSEHKSIQQDDSKNSNDDLGLDKIENLLKGKQFSRDESNRLMEILKSRMVDVSNVEGEKEAPNVISQSQSKENVLNRETPSALNMGKRYDVERNVPETPMPRLQSNMQDEVAASPIDIARAYMGNRTSELGFNTYSNQRNDLFQSKPPILTPSSKSSTCWPGAMVQDQRGYLTPQSQRSRYGLHNIPRTPYSRTIYSRTKPKLNQLQDGNKPSNLSMTTFQQSRTPSYSQMKSSSEVMDGGHGSVGPIRRVRNKFTFEPRSQGPTIRSSPQIPPSSSASRSFVPIFQKNIEPSGTIGTSNVHTTDKHDQTPAGPSNETVKKILEQLDRHKPTPKEKAAELKIATEWKRSSSSQDTTSLIPKGDILLSKDLQKNAEIKTSSSLDTAGAGPSFQKSTFTNTKEKEKSEPRFFNNQINGQDLPKKRPSQPLLQPISFKRPDPQQVISSDNGRGFTFPFSASATSASEPPTPSIMPSFPPQSTELPIIPTYNFGTKKLNERLVFSFPSTSNTAIKDGESDYKFKFGSDKKRVSFGSIGNDAIVIN